MAKRKAARTTAGGRNKGGGRKAAGRARKPASRASGRTAKKAASRRSAKPAKKAAKKAAGTAKAAKTRTAPGAARARAATRKTAKRASPQTRAKTARRAAQALPMRKAPSLNRERRTIVDDDIVQSTPPSSLDLDRTASAARTGRRSLKVRYDEHTETSPALTGGDVDADWESAYSVGDEAPGGDNPTPDQDIVDDIGKAVGIEYQDTEELKGADKVEKRDRKRWELDPASSEDWDDR
jgi:hypothetical protein